MGPVKLNPSAFKHPVEVALESGNELADFHHNALLSQVALQKVGISDFKMPLLFVYKDGSTRSHDAGLDMFVTLPKGKGGINMSRLCLIVQEETEDRPVNFLTMMKILERYRHEMRDEPGEKIFPGAFLNIHFNIALRQTSLKSDNWGWKSYPVSLMAESTDNGDAFSVRLSYEYASTCPCSLTLSKQYENQYKAGQTQEGTGVAVAHSQRSKLELTLKIVASPRKKQNLTFHVEDIINNLRTIIPTETQSLVKRIDEQAFAILNGEFPVFVEHIALKLHDWLDAEGLIDDWKAEINHYESLHSHNASAVVCKGIEGGLR